MCESKQPLLPKSESAITDATLLSLCMIVRDNARTLRPALESIRPYVDEMIVVDTGSIDETPEIAKSLGAKVFHFPWCDDFAKARNESLKYASGRWLFWMDSDDTIPKPCGERLRQLSRRPLDEAPMAYVMQVHCPGSGKEGDRDVTVVDHVRMFRNDPEIRFEGRIHEQVLVSIRRLEGRLEFTDIHVVHSGSDHSEAGRKRKQERDLRLIELELADQPEHPFHLFNLGMTLADMGRHAEAITALQKTLEVAQPHESHVRKAYALLASSLTQLAQYDEALTAAESGLAIYPCDVELHFRRGIVLHHLNRREAAIADYRQALEQKDERHFASVDPGISGYKARHNLAVIYTELQQPSHAELQWRLALEEVPTYRSAWRGLCESLIAQRKFVACEVELARMNDYLPHPPSISILHYLLAQARGDREQSREIIGTARDDYPDDLEILRLWCQEQFESGDFTAAERGLRALTQRDSGDGAAWHNLGLVLSSQARLSEAAHCLRTSLRIRPDAPHSRAHLSHVLAQLGENNEAIQPDGP